MTRGESSSTQLEVRSITWTLRLRARLQEVATGWLYVLPALLLFAVWWLYPLAYSFFVSLTDWDFISPDKKFVGLQNYAHLIRHAEFWQVLWNTTYFSVAVVVGSMVLGLAFALLLNRKLRGTAFYRALIFTPYVTPIVAVSMVWSWIYDPRAGLANWALSLVGLPKLQWLSSSTWAMPAIIIMSIWKSAGYNMLFFLAGMQSIPPEVYEAAQMDGAKGWQRFRHVTLPLLSPTTFFLLVISFIGAFNAFDQIQVMTQGGPAGATRTIVYYLYQNAFQFFDVGYASAVAIALLLITLALTLVQFRLSKRWVHYE